MAIDLTGGEVKVLGNCGDKHLFRLSNPEGEDIIDVDGTYEAEFITDTGAISEVTLGLSELVTGSLFFTVTIANGFYRIRRLEPRRTLLTIEVDGR